MAKVVLGLGSSHTPQMSTSAAYWAEHAKRDEANQQLLCADGEFRAYAEVFSAAAPALLDEVRPEIWQRKFDEAQAAVESLAKRLADARPEIVVIVGDDQRELFGADGVPAIGLFVGDRLWDLPPDAGRLARIPPDIQVANWAAHAERPEAYPVATALSSHLAEALSAKDFDLTVMSEQPEGRGLGHAFTFVRRRLRLAASVPIVPILLNTYFPPNVPSPSRAWRLGQALRAGIESWDEEARVAIFASGGLSHFVVLEDLDRRVLAGLEAGDAGVFHRLPSKLMRSGTSETLNWIVAGGALHDLSFDLVDYIPAYRSVAGTGVGMAFATWNTPSRSLASKIAQRDMVLATKELRRRRESPD